MQYWSSSDESCYDCGANCFQCADENAQCLTCFQTFDEGNAFVVSEEDRTTCVYTEGAAWSPCQDPDFPFYHPAMGWCSTCNDGCESCYTGSAECATCYPDTDQNYYLIDPIDNTKCQTFFRCTDPKCNACDETTGVCIECADGYAFNGDGETCSEVSDSRCQFQVGAVDGEQRCVNGRWSDKRILPPFQDDVEYVDWREEGVVNTPRDQSTCGSCWAFMSAASMETQYAI